MIPERNVAMENNMIPVVTSSVSEPAETDTHSAGLFAGAFRITTADTDTETSEETTTINTTEVHNEVSEEQRDEESSPSEKEEITTTGTEAVADETLRTETEISSGTTDNAVTEVTAETTVPAIVTEVSETEAVTEVPEETVVSEGNDAVGGAAFLLVGAVGAAAAAGAFLHKKKRMSGDADDQSLSAKERDAARINKGKKKKPKKKAIKKKRVVPKTTQKTLPYIHVCDDYIFLVDEHKYSKTYKFEDVNYAIAKQEEQESIFLGYCSVLNSFDTNADIQITVHNNRVNKADFDDMVLLKHKGDSFDHYIDVYNKMLVEKMEQGQNGIIRNKYLTVSVQAADLESAKAKFNTIDIDLYNAFKKIGSVVTPLTSNERIVMLKDIFRNVDEKIPTFDQNDYIRGSERAYCCPDYFEFKKDYFMWGDKYARTMFIKDLPASLKDNMLTDITNTNLDVMVSVNIAPVDPYKALKIVNHQLTSMRANKLQAEKKAIQSGYTSDVINEDLKHSLVEAEELLDDLRSKNQKMFLNNIIIMVTGKDYEELENNTEAIEGVIRKHICSVSTLKFQQEAGMQSVLPLGNCTLNLRITMTTESTAVFLPFSAKEISQNNGMYYGLNALSNNMIIFSRLSLKNPNGFILGSPGSGKSFAAKREMLNVFLATGDDIIIIDPEREYTNLVSAMNGSTIYVGPSSKNYINPLDMSKDYSDDESPLVMKSDFILSFCECLVGKQGLTAKERGIIDRCLTMTYGEYVQNFDQNKLPTLMDFYENLKNQPEKEAQGLALSFELYIKGNLNVFAHKTNINLTNRVVSFDIKDLGKQLKTIGMLIVLDFIWNKITENRAKGKRTYSSGTDRPSHRCRSDAYRIMQKAYNAVVLSFVSMNIGGNMAVYRVFRSSSSANIKVLHIKSNLSSCV